MSATAEAWLDDVIAHRGDDAPRLIFADWLEEHGDEARAEFIRVQCELARYPPAPTGLSDGFAAGRWRERRDALRRRERELLRRHVQDWIPPVSGLAVWTHFAEGREPQYGWLNKPRGVDGTGLPVTFRRGFVAEIACTLADWYGGPCGRCGGRGHHGGRLGCSDCASTGRTPGHGPALVRAAPLKYVSLSDREPSEVGPTSPASPPPRHFWRWFDGSRIGSPDGYDADQLPGPLWQTYASLEETWEHPTRQHALDTLSRACLAWANAEADRAAR